MSDLLRLSALDDEDLKVISAHLQDAVLRVGDIEYLAAEGRFLLALNRFVWEKPHGWLRKRYERRRSALHFDRVLSVARTGFDPRREDDVLELLAVTFTATDAPEGDIELLFAGGAGIRLRVECIEARLTDLGGAWETRYKPVHPV